LPLSKAIRKSELPLSDAAVFTARSIRVYCASIKNYAPHERRAGGKLEIITRFYDNNIYYFITVTPRAVVKIMVIAVAVVMSYCFY